MEVTIQGECLDILKNISSNSVQMVLTDLPYGITSNKWDCEIDLTKLWPELLRIAKENAVFAFTSCQPFTSKLVCSKIELWRHEWVWLKNRGSNFANTVREPFKEHETVQIFSRGQWIYNKQMQERAESGRERVKNPVKFETSSENYREFDRVETKIMPVLRVPSSYQKFNTETGLHPTQKPVPLFEYLIKTYTNENDVVLDCCAGSGTTGIAARNVRRGFILIEKEPEHYETLVKRLKKTEKTENEFFS